MSYNPANLSLIGTSTATGQSVYNYDAGADQKNAVSSGGYFAGAGLNVNDLVLTKISNPSVIHDVMVVHSVTPQVQVNDIMQF